MSSTLAVVLAGGEGERLSLLSSIRAKPAVPFAGKYRVIDFTLSNCVNSGITSVLVLTQYNPRSLNDHIGVGRPWDLDRNTGGVRIMQPYISRDRAREWYRGTADAVSANQEAIDQAGADIVLVLAGDHIYKMDYGPFIQQHRRKRADVTIAVKPVPIGEAHRFGILALDDQDAVTDWQEKPRQPMSDLASLGIYVFSHRALDRWLGEGRDDFGRDVVPAMLAGGARVFGYRFDGYWQDVGTVHSYWEAHMELLDDHPQLDLYDRDWVIHTRSEERPPAWIGPTASVHRSLVSHGCVIAGTVERSVLSPGVRVDPGADRARQRDHVRHRHPRRCRRGPRDHRQAGERRTERGRRHGQRRRCAQPQGARAAQYRHHGRGQARGHPGLGDDRAQRPHRPRRPAVGLPVAAHQERRQRRAACQEPAARAHPKRRRGGHAEPGRRGRARPPLAATR